MAAHPLAHPWAHLREEGRNSVVGRPLVVEEEGRQAADCSSSKNRRRKTTTPKYLILGNMQKVEALMILCYWTSFAVPVHVGDPKCL